MLGCEFKGQIVSLGDDIDSIRENYFHSGSEEKINEGIKLLAEKYPLTEKLNLSFANILRLEENPDLPKIYGFSEKRSDILFKPVLCDIRDFYIVDQLFKEFKPQVVFHAAAYKHVSLVEENPFEAVSNNILGTKVCVESAIETEVETFVLISTDKAVRPTNIMGATKRFSELILQSIASENKTKMTMVRFGNVIGSSGSAVPLFQKQIKEGGPVTVTHPDIVRYFMSIPEAAELVIQAGAMGEGGDVFVLDMGEPVKILEIAKRLINLSGMEIIDSENPHGDIEIEFTGLRPGEKLYEELLINPSQSQPTQHPRIFCSEEPLPDSESLQKEIQLLSDAISKRDLNSALESMKRLVPEYEPDNGK